MAAGSIRPAWRTPIIGPRPPLRPRSQRPSHRAGEPRNELATSFDHLVGTHQRRRREREAERLCGFEIDHQFDLGGPLNRQISRLLTRRPRRR
jgi:hypothetical protein